MQKVQIILCLFFFISFNDVNFSQNREKMKMKPIPVLDLQKYVGSWYELYRMPVSYEDGLNNVTATYTLRSDGKIAVLNEGINEAGKHRKANGVAWRPEPSEPARLRVRFFWPFSGDYRVVDIDDQYQWAIVVSGSAKYAWILCRRPHPDPKLMEELLIKSKNLGIPVEIMIKVKHD